MFAHLLDPHDFEVIALQTENQPIESGQSDCPVPFPVALEQMAIQTGKHLQFIEIPNLFDEINSLDVPAGDLFPINLACLDMVFILALQLTGTEFDFHAHLSTKKSYFAMFYP